MRLIDPQPMETLPEEGEVFVEFKYVGNATTWIDWYDVDHLRCKTANPQYNRRLLAWSYTATTKEPT